MPGRLTGNYLGYLPLAIPLCVNVEIRGRVPHAFYVHMQCLASALEGLSVRGTMKAARNRE